MALELAGKVAVVTGGGSGIGAAMAGACGAAGMRVAVVDVNAERAAGVVAMLRDNGVDTEGFAVDVSDAAAVERLAAAVFDRFGGCQLLHNNAGILPFGRSWEHGDAEWREVLGVNLLGAVHGVTAFVPRLIDQATPAHIVNTVSAAALRYVPATALYNTTKFALLGFTEGLREELAPYGIGVTALCPGGVATKIGSTPVVNAKPRSDEEMAALLADLGTVEAAHTTSISADDVAQLVLWAVRHNEAYVITHPGSLDAVSARHAAIEDAYRQQRQRHPELP